MPVFYLRILITSLVSSNSSSVYFQILKKWKDNIKLHGPIAACQKICIIIDLNKCTVHQTIWHTMVNVSDMTRSSVIVLSTSILFLIISMKTKQPKVCGVLSFYYWPYSLILWITMAISHHINHFVLPLENTWYQMLY